MRNSSTARSEYEDPGAGETLDLSRTEASLRNLTVSSASLLRPISEGNVYANAAKLAGRLNANAIPLEEQIALLEERQTLLDKKLAGDITRKEANRLEYVRWNLDRIEDAKHGVSLDILETEVLRYEEFEANLANLREQLAGAAESERERQRRRSRGHRR
jgi:hypothetical protein